MDTASEICIICLGELPIQDSAPADQQQTPAVEDDDDAVVSSRRRRQKSPVKSDDGYIANLRPCNHYLHDDCIKQWIDKANSCPICRAGFNVVELSRYLQGPILSSYVVQDKQQQQELDQAALAAYAALDEEPCIVCGANAGADDTFLICDGCEEYCHIHCAGLDSIPEGVFICPSCQQEGLTPAELDRVHGNVPAPQASATLLQSAIHRHSHRDGSSLSQRSTANRQRRENAQWASVWQAVLDRTNLDLDFPFAIHQSRPRSGQERRDAEQAAEDAWLLRWQIAEQQGAGFVFEETTRRLLPRHHQVETEEETQAWRLADRARAAAADPDSSRKRKRTTPTPHTEDAQPQRRFKKPRTRVSGAEPRNGEASSSRSRRPADNERASDNAGNNSTFLQSLLGHIDAGQTSASSPSGYQSDAVVPREPRHGSISNASSPGSPYLSNPATPRSLSPQPMSPSSRLSSPPLSPPPNVPTFSPSVSMLSPGSDEEPSHRKPRKPNVASPPAQRTHSAQRRPSPTVLSLEHKTEIQKMVSDALKPFYRKRDIDKDEYTVINRDISRILYDKVSFDGGLKDEAARDRWKANAALEVERSVEATIAAKTRVDTPTASSSTSRRVPQVASSA